MPDRAARPAAPPLSPDGAVASCCLCGNRSLRVLTTVLRDGPGRVLHCADCDLGILERDGAAPLDLDAYYDGQYRAQYGPELGRSADQQQIFEAHVDHQAQRLELLAPYLTETASVLEVGCSTGHLLVHLDARVRRAVGVDLDSAATAFARDRFGLETYGCALGEAGLEEAGFDLVLAVQTLEHLDDPVASCAEFARYLKPGGQLFIEVPNLYDPLLVLYEAPRYRSFYYHRAHLWYFSAASLTAVLARAGVTGSVSYAQDYNLLNHLHWALLNAPQASSRDGLGPARLPLQPGLDAALVAELDGLMADTDRRYKAILARHGAAENLCFVGSLSAASR